MSDRFDTSSASGEWESMDEYLVRDERLDLTQKIAKLEEENRKVNEELKTKKRKIEEKEEENKRIKEENNILKSQIKQNENVFTLHKWMKEAMEEIRLSNGKLSEKTMEVYKTIWKKEVSKLQSTTSSERKQLTEELQKLEDLCENISNNVKKVNEESIQEITKHLSSRTIAKPKRRVEFSLKKPIDRFLGKYTNASATAAGYCKAFEIRKADEDGYYEIHFTFHSGKTSTGSKWIPNNEDRNGSKVFVGSDVLSMYYHCEYTSYCICEQGLIRNGHLYVRA